MYLTGLPWWLSGKEPVCKRRRDTWVQSLIEEDFWEKEMAIHLRFLSRQIPWSEEPGGLQFMGHKRFRHDWAAKPTKYTTIWSKFLQAIKP